MPSDPVLALSFISPVTVNMTGCGREAEKLWRVQRAILQTLPMSYMLSRLYHTPGGLQGQATCRSTSGAPEQQPVVVSRLVIES